MEFMSGTEWLKTQTHPSFLSPVSMDSTELSGSSKRAKAPGSVSQVANCLVDGCNADLSQCREYHRRHKVCESHSKTPKVAIGGREQRFCQQCSRFHSLIEFDEGKRSCRKRLDGHNRRRRKPQAESSRNPGLIFLNEPGARLLSFSSPEPFSSSMASTGWGGVINTDKDMLTYNNQADINYPSSHHDLEGLNQFQFLQSTDCSLPEASMHVPIFGPNSASASSSQKIFSDGSNHQVVDSGRALSLLSSGPSISKEIGLSHHMVLCDDSMNHSHPLAHHSLQQFSRAGQYPFQQDVENKPVVSVADSQISNHSNLHFQETFQNGPDGSSTSGSQQTLTFMWE